jgi:hypothetical protein
MALVGSSSNVMGWTVPASIGEEYLVIGMEDFHGYYDSRTGYVEELVSTALR